jgi:hypothetical protein
MTVTLELLLFMVEVLDTQPREEQLLDHPPMVAQKEELSLPLRVLTSSRTLIPGVIKIHLSNLDMLEDS